MIPYGRQDIDEADIQAVIDVLRSDFITQGPAIERFEKAVADYCGAKYAVAVCNATAGLHLACLAAGLGEGDLHWTVPTTFVASANCGRYCGADVDFVDIHPQTYLMDVDALAEKLARAKQAGRLPKTVAPVHLCGQSCEMDRIRELSRQYGFTVIEDAAHAIGASYKDSKVGSCAFSDMAVFSFHPVKIITTGEGGMITTNDKSLYETLILLRSHGITRDAELLHEKNPPGWYYEQLELGFNYRMTDIQAALGASQMTRLDAFVTARHWLVDRYNERLAHLPLTLPWQHPDTYSAFHLYIIRLQPDKTQKSHREVFEALRAAGIGVNLHYFPVHLQPYYRQLGFAEGMFPESERYVHEAITLPLFSGMTEAQQDEVISALTQLLSGAPAESAPA